VIRRLGDPVFRSGDLLSLLFSMSSPGSQRERVEPAILAYRIYADGHEELLRNSNLPGVSVQSFKDILAVSNTRTVYAAPFTARSGSPFNFNPFSSSAPLLVSYVVPSSLLFEEMSVQKPSGEVPKPTTSRHPYFDK